MLMTELELLNILDIGERVDIECNFKIVNSIFQQKNI